MHNASYPSSWLCLYSMLRGGMTTEVQTWSHCVYPRSSPVAPWGCTKTIVHLFLARPVAASAKMAATAGFTAAAEPWLRRLKSSASAAEGAGVPPAGVEGHATCGLAGLAALRVQPPAQLLHKRECAARAFAVVSGTHVCATQAQTVGWRLPHAVHGLVRVYPRCGAGADT